MRGGVGVALAAMVLACTLAGGGGCGDADEDTDGDGLSDRDERDVYGTSPLLADTDGDGFSDYEELIGKGFDPAYPYRFNPRVADVPEIRLELVSRPAIALVFVDTKGVSETFTSTDAVTATATETGTVAQANQQTDSISTPQTVTRTVALTGPTTRPDAGAADAATDAPAAAPAPPPAPTTRADTTSIADTFTPTSTSQVTYTFTDADSRAFAQTLSNADAYGISHLIAESAGLLKVTTVLTNAGNVGFSMLSMVMSATLKTKASKVAPVGNLVMDTPYFVPIPIALAPGQSTGPLVFIRSSLALEQVHALMDDASALVLQLGAYQLDDLDGRPFAARLTDVASRTAQVGIDYGGRRPPERYRVATNLGRVTLPQSRILRPELGKVVQGISVGEALSDILSIPFAADGTSGLTSIRGVEASPGGAASWSVRHAHGTGPDAMTTTFDPKVETFDFAAIPLRAGDLLELTLPRDASDASDAGDGSSNSAPSESAGDAESR